MAVPTMALELKVPLIALQIVYILYVARRLWVGGRAAWRAMTASMTGWGSKLGDNDPEVIEMVQLKLAARRVSLSRHVMFYFWTAIWVWSVCFISGLLGRGNAAVCACAIGAMLLFFGATTVPKAVSEWTLPAFHVVIMAIVCGLAFFMPAEISDTRNLTVWMSSLAAAGVCLRFRLLFVTNSALLACCISALSLEADTWEDTVYRRQIGGEIFAFLVRLGVFYASEAMIAYTTRKEVEASCGKRQRYAATALLDMMCDAVVDLDHSLSLKEHAPKLACLLMHGTGKDLQGTDFSSLIPLGDDRARFEEVLDRGRSEDGMLTPGMATLRMRDAIGNFPKVVLYLVPYTSIGGRLNHLVGLREDIERGHGGDSEPTSLRFAPIGRGMPEAVLRPHIAQVLGEVMTSAAAPSRSVCSSKPPSIGSCPSEMPSQVGEREVEEGMRATLLVEEGLPVTSVGQQLLCDLGREEMGLQRFSDVFPDKGRKFLAWLKLVANEVDNISAGAGISRNFGRSVELKCVSGGRETIINRSIGVYFPKRTGTDDGTVYCVNIGVTAGASIPAKRRSPSPVASVALTPVVPAQAPGKNVACL